MTCTQLPTLDNASTVSENAQGGFVEDEQRPYPSIVKRRRKTPPENRCVSLSLTILSFSQIFLKSNNLGRIKWKMPLWWRNFQVN